MRERPEDLAFRAFLFTLAWSLVCSPQLKIHAVLQQNDSRTLCQRTMFIVRIIAAQIKKQTKQVKFEIYFRSFN